MKNRMSFFLVSIALFSLVFFNCCCKKEPPVVPPPPTQDSISTVERELADGQEPAVSPDGKKIAYTYNGCIYVMDTSGANITQLTSGPADVLPRWHPNGQTIGFMRLTQPTDSNAKIFTVPVNGGAATEIPMSHFVSNALKLYTEVYSGIGMPLWDYSPDGKYVAYLSLEGTKTYLNVVNVSDTQQFLHRQIYDNPLPTSGNASSFAWSLNSDEIAFTTQIEYPTYCVYLLNFSTNIHHIDTTASDLLYVTRAPLSNKFAYIIVDVLTVFAQVTDFSTPTTRFHVSSGQGLKWSPDEKYFLYNWEGTVGGAFGYNYSQMYIYDIEKGKEYRLTNRGDINRYDFYFEWAKAPNTVFFERFGKICQVIFQLPQ